MHCVHTLTPLIQKGLGMNNYSSLKERLETNTKVEGVAPYIYKQVRLTVKKQPKGEVFSS